MVKVTSFSSTICETPAVIQDQLFVRKYESRKSIGIPCREISDVLAVTGQSGSTACDIRLQNGVDLLATDNPATVRQMWLEWAADNLRYTTEVNRG